MYYPSQHIFERFRVKSYNLTQSPPAPELCKLRILAEGFASGCLGALVSSKCQLDTAELLLKEMWITGHWSLSRVTGHRAGPNGRSRAGQPVDTNQGFRTLGSGGSAGCGCGCWPTHTQHRCPLAHARNAQPMRLNTAACRGSVRTPLRASCRLSSPEPGGYPSGDWAQHPHSLSKHDLFTI